MNADAWEAAALFLAEHGHRAIAHDRRGHGRSSQTWHGNEMDTYADDLACLIETLDLSDLTLVGHSTGGGEIVRYVGRHGTGRVAKLVLVSAVPPLMLQTDDNPEGLPDRGVRRDPRRARPPTARSSTAIWPTGRSSATTATSDVAQGFRDAFWLQSMACGHRAAYECIAAFSATDFRPDLAEIDVPTLVIHGDDDQIVPFEVGGKRSAELVAGAELKVYEGGESRTARHRPGTDCTPTCSPSSTAETPQPDARPHHASSPAT